MSQVANMERASSMSKYPKRKGGQLQDVVDMVLYMNGTSEKAEIAITISFRPMSPGPPPSDTPPKRCDEQRALFYRSQKRRIKLT